MIFEHFLHIATPYSCIECSSRGGQKGHCQKCDKPLEPSGSPFASISSLWLHLRSSYLNTPPMYSSSSDPPRSTQDVIQFSKNTIWSYLWLVMVVRVGFLWVWVLLFAAKFYHLFSKTYFIKKSNLRTGETVELCLHKYMNLTLFSID